MHALLLDAAPRLPDLLPQTMEVAQVIAHGWFRHVARSCEAALVLLEAGYDHEATPLHRSILEHTASLVWLANSGQTAVDAVQLNHQHKLGKLVLKLDDGWPAVPSATLEQLELELPKSPERFLLHVADLLKHFGLEAFEVPWLAQCAITHPTLRSASCFWRRSSDGSVELTLNPVSGEDQLPTLLGNANLLLITTRAVHELAGGFGDVLERAAELIGGPVELPRAKIN